jgi:hypothetical protein
MLKVEVLNQDKVWPRPYRTTLGPPPLHGVPDHIGPSALAFHARIPQPTGCKRQLCRVFEGIQRKRVQADPSMRSPTTAAVHTSEAFRNGETGGRTTAARSSEGKIHSSTSNGAVNLKLHFYLDGYIMSQKLVQHAATSGGFLICAPYHIFICTIK